MYNEIKVTFSIGGKDYYFNSSYAIEELKDIDKVPKIKSADLNKIVALLGSYEYELRVVPA